MHGALPPAPPPDSVEPQVTSMHMPGFHIQHGQVQHQWHPGYDASMHPQSAHTPQFDAAAMAGHLQQLQAQHQQWHQAYGGGTPGTSSTVTTPSPWHPTHLPGVGGHPQFSPSDRPSSSSPVPADASTTSPSQGPSGEGIDGAQPIISAATGGNVTRFPSNIKPKPSSSVKAVPDPEDPNFAIISEVRDEKTGKMKKIFRCAYPGCNKECNRLYNLKSHVLVHSSK